MDLILTALIGALILSSQPIVDTMLVNLVPTAFYAEDYMSTSLGSPVNLDFSGLFNLFFGFGVSLIVLKFLKKGFEVYISWGEGDPDSDPFSFVIGFLRAMAVALCFPILYDALVDVTSQMIDQTVSIIGGLSSQQSIVDFILNIISVGLFQAIIGLLVIIIYLILWIQFMMRGIEMMVMRVGIPIVCTGLIDSDKGIFATYMKKFFLNAATVLIQIALIKLSLTVMLLGNAIYALAIGFVAMRTPKFLQEFMLNVSGAGGTVINTVYHTSRLFQMAKQVFTK